MSYAVWFTKEGIKVIDARDLVNRENAEVLFSIARSSADNTAPIVEGWLDTRLFEDLVKAAARIDVNEYTKKTFAAVLGVLAGVATLPLGPTAALAADQAFSSTFEWAYESANDWSRGLDWSPLFDFIDHTLGVNQYDAFLAASSTRPQPIYRDPLAIDLDGDGIETVGIGSTPVTFDHNADGVRTGTGWVTGDDAWLVIDRNGNGSIDSGRELFGVDYLKANNQFATNDSLNGSYYADTYVFRASPIKISGLAVLEIICWCRCWEPVGKCR